MKNWHINKHLEHLFPGWHIAYVQTWHIISHHTVLFVFTSRV